MYLLNIGIDTPKNFVNDLLSLFSMLFHENYLNIWNLNIRKNLRNTRCEKLKNEKFDTDEKVTTRTTKLYG